jgi:hypothetical protein
MCGFLKQEDISRLICIKRGNKLIELKNIIYGQIIMYSFNNDSPQTTQSCPLLTHSNQTSQEVTHPDTTLAEARLTVLIALGVLIGLWSLRH